MKRSYFIMPFSVAAHLVTINIVLYLLTPSTYLDITTILGYNAAWICISIGLNFYSVERKERFITKFHKFLRHYFIFCLSYFAIFAFLDIQFSLVYQLFVLCFLLFFLIFYRWFFFIVRKLYRVEGGNFVNVLVYV